MKAEDNAVYTPSRSTMASIKDGLFDTKASVSSVKTYMIAAAFVIIAMLSANFGLSVAATQMSWESHIENGKLTTTDGDVMATGTAVTFVQEDATTMAYSDLAAVDEITVTVGEIDVTLKVSGFYYSFGTSVTFITAEGDVTVVNGGTASIVLKADSSLNALESTSRKLLIGGCNAPGAIDTWQDGSYGCNRLWECEESGGQGFVADNFGSYTVHCDPDLPGGSIIVGGDGSITVLRMRKNTFAA